MGQEAENYITSGLTVFSDIPLHGGGGVVQLTARLKLLIVGFGHSYGV